MGTVLLIFAMFIAVPGIIHSQTKTNLEIFEKHISEKLDEMLWKPDIKRDLQFVFVVNSADRNEDEVKFIKSVIRKTAERNKVRAGFSGQMASEDSIYNAVLIDVFALGTRYPGFAKNTFLGDKSVKRNLFGNIRVEIKSTELYHNLDSIKFNYNDAVDYNELENIESGDYSFTRAKAPQVSSFEEIIFPAAIIAVSVIAAVLFFSIRSK